MKYSHLFGKTTKNTSKDATLTSHKLLLQAGFIRESVAGRYFFLPLGMRVRNKVAQIIREEMDGAGAQEMLSPILHPLELWEETNRNNAGNFGLMEVTDRREAKFALGGTAEEMFVDVVRKFQLSYKDLPFNIYQFSQKFRDELRARGGLLRTREFMMKDAYSFDTDAQAFQKTYDLMARTYSRIFARLGLETKKVLADNGYIGGEYCHEYIVDSPVGESRYLYTEDGSYCAHEDVAKILLEHKNPDEKTSELQVAEQPSWVKTMDDNVKHYKLPKWRFLKNVVYKRSDTGQIIIATIRGDLEVNKTKLESVLGAIELLEDATDEDLASLGTKSGYVHSWGHDAYYVGDESLKSVTNFIGGQKEETTDTRNVNYGRDFECDLVADISVAQAGQKTVDGKELIEGRGVEVGNIFQLGTHYSSKMHSATYQDSNDEAVPYYMGCYGIGVGRTIATIVEHYSDENGMLWPANIAPFQVHLISLRGGEEHATKLYKELQCAGIEVLWDERDVSAGEKLADADLIGIPIRLVVSKRTGEQTEFKLRSESESILLDPSQIVARARQLLQKVQ